MAEIRSTTHINAAPGAVFDFIDQYRNAMRYMRRIVRYDLVDPDGGTGVGAEFLISVQAGPTLLDGHIRVVQHERPHAIVFKTVEGTRVEGSWRITPEDGGSRVVLQSYYEPPGGLVGRIVASFIKANAQKDFDASLRELKRLVESSAPSPSGG